VRPSARELIEGVAAALERDVAPQLSDRWAASALRSAVQLLNHLAVRVEVEARVLLEDNDDARRVLESVCARLGSSPADAALRAMIETALGAPEPPRHDAVLLDEANEALQRVIEHVLRRRTLAEDPQGMIHMDLRAYLRRRLERERPLYFPAFTGAPF